MKRLAAILILVPALHAQRFVKTFNTIADMTAANTRDVHTNAYVVGYSTPNDGGGGNFTWSFGSAGATNLGTVFVSQTGASGRWLRKYSGPVMTRWFGAKGDGSTDDTTAIQNAITTAASVGTSVQFEPGTNSVSYLLLSSPIQGYGLQSVIKPSSSLAIENSNVSVSNLRIFAQADVATYTTNTLLTNIVFDRVSFDWPSTLVTTNYLAINSSYTEGLKIQNCVFRRGGIQTTRANNVEILNNYFDMDFLNGNEPIHLSFFSRGRIEGNTILRTATDAIDLFSSGDRCIVANNRIDGVGSLASGWVAESCITLKVDLKDSAGGSGSALGYVESSQIRGNLIKNYVPTLETNRWFGIYAKCIDERSSPSFSLTNASRNLLISGNIIEGFWTNNPAGFTNAYYAGIHFDGSDASITDNIICNISTQNESSPSAQTCGIELGFNDPVQFKVVRTTVANNHYQGEGTGLVLYYLDSCVIANNTIGQDDATGMKPRFGVTVFGSINWSSFVGNTINVTFTNPIAWQHSNGTLSHCSFIGNTSFSVSKWFFPGTDHTTFTGNIFGAVEIGTAGTQALGNIFIGNQIRALSPSEPGAFTALSQKGMIFTGNYLHFGVYPVRIEGTAGDQTISNNCIIKNNISEGMSGGVFTNYVNVDASSVATFLFSDNIYNP